MRRIITNGTIWLEKVDSTSAYVSRNLGNLGDCGVVAALEQTAGRGQADHKWHSRSGENLTFSIFVSYDKTHGISAGKQQILTMASSLAVCDFLLENGIKAGIKKPNDIYVDDKKICGMLIENSLSGQNMHRSIIGMGININETEFPDDLPNPVSMAILTGKRYDIKKCLSDFLKHFEERFCMIWSEPERLSREYLSLLISVQP